MNKFGIIVIGYDRADSVNRLLNGLSNAYYGGDSVTLIISIDKSNVVEVYDVAQKFNWKNGNKIIETQEKRLGLKKHILKCGSYMEKYGLDAVAVFEDDVYPSKAFFEYMKQTVTQYQDNQDIAGISLYSQPMNKGARLPFIPNPSKYDVYFVQYAESWGQIWLRNQWKDFSKWLMNENDDVFVPEKIPPFVCGFGDRSWLKYHIKYCIEKNKYFVYPYKSYSTCFCDAGEHSGGGITLYQTPLEESAAYKLRLPDGFDEAVVYDAFFEVVDKTNTICFDLYGQKIDYTGYKKLVTCHNDVPFKCIETYGLQIKPHEMNYFMKIPGNSIYVYDLEENCIKNRKKVDLVEKLNYYNSYNPNIHFTFELYVELVRKWISYMWGRRKNLIKKLNRSIRFLE